MLANQLLRDAGRTIGEVLASAVSLLNPSVIVIGGTMAEAGDPLLAGVREIVYRRSLPLATAELRIVQAAAGDRSGIVGAAVMVIDRVLAPDAVDRLRRLNRHRCGVRTEQRRDHLDAPADRALADVAEARPPAAAASVARPVRYSLIPWRPIERSRACSMTAVSSAPAGRWSTAWKPAASPLSSSRAPARPTPRRGRRRRPA